jgi:ABC-2 type transport system ATP-binding protein
VVAGALDDLRGSYRRIQFVFEHDAPEVTFRTPGAGRVRREGRVLTLLASAGADGIVEEARALHPVSVDIVPVALKEIFLETVVGED